MRRSNFVRENRRPKSGHEKKEKEAVLVAKAKAEDDAGRFIFLDTEDGGCDVWQSSWAGYDPEAGGDFYGFRNLGHVGPDGGNIVVGGKSIKITKEQNEN